MKTPFLSTFMALFIVCNMFSQSNLNDFKYIIVPNKYDFLKEKDQYQLNSLTEFLFNKYGFRALKEGVAYPEDLLKNRCLALKSDVLKDSGLFKTKLNVELKDCNDQVVYTSPTGESREKEYAKAYNEALRNAFMPLQSINYKYEPKAVEVVAEEKVDTNKEIERLKQEIENIKKAKEVELIDEVVSEEAVNMADVEEEVAISPADMKEEKSTETAVKKVMPSILYAQQIENGYQLVDSTPKVVYKIKNTSLENVFLVEGKNATLYKKGDTWILEYYENNVLKQEVLSIKF